MADREDRGRHRRDRFDALDTALHRFLDGEGGPSVARSHGVGFAELVEAASESHEMAGTDLSGHLGDASPRRAGMDDEVCGPGDATAADPVRLFPEGRPTRVVAVPRRCMEPDVGARPDADLPPDGVGRVIAVAPECYDSGDVAGSEVTVILDPLTRWSRHPAYARGGRHTGTVVRAWEAFTLDGEPLGLVLWSDDEFVGMDMTGRRSPERTLAGAAWQIAANR